ncbi:MAG: hypothetical protein J0I12_02795 [Candidatus Eremiobacteraeota bacterium]|nr:hypothetical protein [Candidatus Eremiobacteraeota bacterium]
MKALLLLLLCTTAALANPTFSGVLRGVSGDEICVEDSQGHFWKGQMTVDCQNLTSNQALQKLKGHKLVYRVRGDLGSIRMVELVGLMENSLLYQSLGVSVPYYTREGEWVGPGGVGGRPPNAPHPGKILNVPAYAPNGGFPHQNHPGI